MGLRGVKYIFEHFAKLLCFFTLQFASFRPKFMFNYFVDLLHHVLPAVVELLAAGLHEQLADAPVGELLAVRDRTHLERTAQHRMSEPKNSNPKNINKKLSS